MNKSFWSFNIGHAITIFGGVISLAIVSGKLQSRVDGLSDRLIKQERSVEEFTRQGLITTVNEHERRLLNLETVAVDFREVRTDVRWIKQKLDTLKP